MNAIAKIHVVAFVITLTGLTSCAYNRYQPRSVPHNLWISNPIDNDCASEINLSIVVFSNYEEYVLPQAYILINGEDQYLSDSLGRIKISLEPGAYKMEVDYVGHTPAMIEDIQIDSCATTYIMCGLGTSILYQTVQ